MPPDGKGTGVAVVIPAYRAAATIGRALAGVAAQTRPPARVVVIDDGSDDNTFGAAAAWTDRFPEGVLRIVRQPNQGAGAARNRGILEAGTDWLGFLDADDEWLPTKLERSLAVAEADDLAMVSHDLRRVAPDGTDHRIDCHRHYAHATQDPFPALFLRGFVATSSVVVRRDAVVAAGGFDPSLGAAQDYDLWLTLYDRLGSRCRVIPEVLTRYHVTAGSITANPLRRLDCGLRVLALHGSAVRRRLGPWGARRLMTLKGAVVHYEALARLRTQGRWTDAAGVALRGGPRLLRLLAAPPLASPPRADHLAGHWNRTEISTTPAQ